ncbi:MAG: HEAT repeat domain-containing protein [Gemmatimonadaceae bacterium]|nr:HEAT repeat domain-containing protein [Gemmatimonadaceae bacterium]MCW5825940.1 HEAT repeat domain-containing protein [Gemmatimonadaceae bacterium]
MKLLTLSLLAALGIGTATDAISRPDPLATSRHIPAASWAPADTADSLWRQGRIAIADERWRDAARSFERLVERYPNSAYAGDALYWQAFALQRSGGNTEIRRAVEVLELQHEKHEQSATYVSGESSALLRRLQGRLARSGDAASAAAIAEIAASAAGIAAHAMAEVMPVVAEELRRAQPEIQAEVAREMAAARAEMAQARAEMATGLRSGAQARRGGRDEIPPGCEGVVDDERIEALNALMQMNSDQAMPVLRRVLERRDRCSEVLRRKAVFIVSQRRGDEAAEILVNVARNDPDRTTRSEAVFWLSQTNSPRAVEVLEQILLRDTPDAEMQKRAIFSLSQTRSSRAATILRDFVRRREASNELRGEAIFWLGQNGGGDNSQFLRELFPSLDNDELRDKVLFSVAQRRSPENAAWLLGRAKDRQLSATLRKSALFWASQSGGATVADLSEIYDNSRDDTELRGQVIFALSQRRNDRAAVDKLLQIASREEDRELRRQAVFWLGQSRDPRAVQALDEIINKPY